MDPNLMLGRVLRHETHVASLLAYLVALDAEPLQRRLGLPQPICGVRTEVQHTKKNRLDVVLDGADGAMAVLELKVSAAEHNDQLTRYNDFAARHGAARFILDLELAPTDVPQGWHPHSLADVFGDWTTSAHPTAREFGGAIAAVLASWQQQALGALSGMEPAMLPVTLRAIKSSLDARGFEAYASSTAAGQPSLTVFAPHPSAEGSARLCVDVRCQNKKDPQQFWIFRAGVETRPTDDLVSARRAAHELAMHIAPALTVEHLRLSLTDALGPGAAAAVLDRRPLKTRGSAAHLDGWLQSVVSAGQGSVPRHPVFHHDWGRRLAAQFHIDPSRVTARELEAMVVATLQVLESAAKAA